MSGFKRDCSSFSKPDGRPCHLYPKFEHAQKPSRVAERETSREEKSWPAANNQSFSSFSCQISIGESVDVGMTIVDENRTLPVLAVCSHAGHQICIGRTKCDTVWLLNFIEFERFGQTIWYICPEPVKDQRRVNADVIIDTHHLQALGEPKKKEPFGPKESIIDMFETECWALA